MTTADSWNRRSSEEIADCRVFKVRRDTSVRSSDGKEGDFFVIESPDWVNVIAVTEEGEIVLIHQFRHGAEEMHLELPGGLIDPCETHLDAAKRELLEETGYTSTEWTLLGVSRPNPAIQNNTIYHYLAEKCVKTANAEFDDHESIECVPTARNEVERKIIEGKISHSLVVAAFFYYAAARPYER